MLNYEPTAAELDALLAGLEAQLARKKKRRADGACDCAACIHDRLTRRLERRARKVAA